VGFPALGRVKAAAIFLLAVRKTIRDPSWQTAKIDTAQKYIRKAYLPTLTQKCLRIFIQPHFTDMGLV